MDKSNCTVTAAAELVKQQFGFDIVLLDSKLFLLRDNSRSSGTDFWKSTRKIIAASKDVYEETVTGKSVENCEY